MIAIAVQPEKLITIMATENKRIAMANASFLSSLIVIKGTIMRV